MLSSPKIKSYFLTVPNFEVKNAPINTAEIDTTNTIKPTFTYKGTSPPFAVTFLEINITKFDVTIPIKPKETLINTT